MKQFYHFYVALNNMEDIHEVIDTDEIKRIDEFWALLLDQTRQELTEEELMELSRNIKQSLE